MTWLAQHAFSLILAGVIAWGIVSLIPREYFRD